MLEARNEDIVPIDAEIEYTPEVASNIEAVLDRQFRIVSKLQMRMEMLLLQAELKNNCDISDDICLTSDALNDAIGGYAILIGEG